jgi:hypothetical protein
VFLDCYCVFCVDCFEQRVRASFEASLDSRFDREQPKCRVCGENTQFKKCDRRNPAEAVTIRQLELRPEIATMRAVEATKFNLLQNERRISHLQQKADFLTDLVFAMVEKHWIVSFDFPEALQRRDTFGFLDRLHRHFNAFSFDTFAPPSLSLIDPATERPTAPDPRQMNTKPRSLPNGGYSHNFQNVTRNVQSQAYPVVSDPSLHLDFQMTKAPEFPPKNLGKRPINLPPRPGNDQIHERKSNFVNPGAIPPAPFTSTRPSLTPVSTRRPQTH